MNSMQGDPLQGLVQQIKAPVTRQSIDEKVEVFERRLNGKVLPFLGLHGTLLALVYLIVKTPAVESLALLHPLLPALALAAAALSCGLLTTAYHFTGCARDIAGAAAAAFCLGLVAILLLPFEGTWAAMQLAAALALCLVLLALNGAGRVADYEFNTVWLYLPLIFLVVGRLSGIEQMLAAVALYGPAIYVKFGLQPGSNKVPLGFSVLVFLGLIIEDSAESEGLIAAMVLLVLVLFVVQSFRMRHVAGSSYRHFLADAIIMGLWAVLVYLLDIGDTAAIILWGSGVAAYQGVAMAMLLRGRADSGDLEARARDPRVLAERDARLAWLQIAVFAIFGELLIDDILEQRFGIDQPYVGVLIIMAPFIPLFRWLQAPFLALSTRLWIAGCLIYSAGQAEDDLGHRYIEPGAGQTLDTLQTDFLANWGSELIGVVFALAVALAATLRITPAFEVAWWRGLIRARHMVLLRRMTRLILANANRIAFVGGFIAAVVALFNWMRYAGGDGSGQRSRDVLLLGAHVYAVAMTVLFARYGLGCCDVEANPLLSASPLTFAEGDLTFALAWSLWGTLLYLRGVLTHDYLARFFATAFVVMPLATFATNNTLDDSAFLAQVVLASGFALFGFGLFRRLAG